jgi:uncharacterized protein (TIGR03437 family)
MLMMAPTRRIRPARQGPIRLLVTLFLTLLPLFAQRDRILEPIESTRTVLLRGNTNPQAQPQYDQGPLDSNTNLGFLRLVLKPSDAQKTALDLLLREQQDPSSSNFRKWLTPDQFADRFGLSANDIARLTAWLESSGLTVNYVSRSRTWIAFSGTAGQVAGVFHTAFHRYRIGSEMRFANVAEPELPAPLAELVIAIAGLDDFHPQPSQIARPALTNRNGAHFLAPDDLATIYDIAPLYRSGVDGAGQKLVILGQTDIDLSVVSVFRDGYGLPPNPPQRVLYGSDPGTSAADLVEAQLDLEWAGAVARHATILYVYSQDVFESAAYAVDQNLAPVMSLSYSLCEPKASANTSPLLQSTAQQANAQGITWLASTGDWGAAACDTKSAARARNGFAVALPSSIPELTAVGGSEFNEGGGSYWSSTNSSTSASALSYIPEVAWNDTAENGWLSATGGGASMFYSKPAWQTGPGVPNDGARDVPDVSLTASADHDPYIICCDSHGVFQVIGGTSASTPAFAGILALLNQYLVNQGALPHPGLGNINPMLYRMAQTTSGVFHDITAGDNIVPCVFGTLDCANGSFGYTAGPGYDLVTGLGSVDAAQLAAQWNAPSTSAASVTLSAQPSSLTLAGTTVLTATVQAANVSITPTGSVSFVWGSLSLGVAALAGGAGTATASLTVYGSQLAVGSETITAVYAGNSSLNGASASITVNVSQPVAAAAIVPSFAPDPVYEQQTDADGFSWFFTVTLTETAGVPATLTGFTFAGHDLSASIVAFFGSSSIPGQGTLSAFLRATIANVPSTVVLGFEGTDANGNRWSQQVSVPFYGRQTSPSLALSSSPSVVLPKPNAPADCQYLQQLDLQEQNGYPVILTRFTAGGTDYTSDIPDWFGSLRLAPFGALTAVICWTGIDPPQTLQYEMDGVDASGNQVIATNSTVFQGPASNPGVLSLSADTLELRVASSSNYANASLTVDLPPGQQWSVTVFPSNRQTSWLVVSPLSGAGPAELSITASGAGLAPGAYRATLVFQSLNTTPQFIDVPVAFTIGEAQYAAISALGNAASFEPALAPGMEMTVFGANLAPASLAASSLPLPLTLGGVSATINGVAAPLYFVSSSQLNVQIPFETAARLALLAIDNNGRVATYRFGVSLSAPGIYTGPGGRVVPIGSGSRGQTLTLFLTGGGDVTPPLATGSAPPSTASLAQLPKPRLPASLTIGGVPATINFIGIPPGMAGITQVNFTIPQNAPLGEQPVEVTVGISTSAAAKLTVNR